MIIPARQLLKKALPSHAEPRRVLSGLFRGLVFEINLQSGFQFWLGLYERETYRWIKRLTCGITAAVDVGAAMGEFSIFLIKKTSARRVIAVDPNPEHRGTFSRNLELNNCADVSGLTRTYKFLGALQANDAETLNGYCDLMTDPVFLKVDVDGAELEVLAGGDEFFRTKRTRMLVETHSPELERSCIDYLLSRDFQVAIVKNGWWRLFLKDQRPCQLNRWLVASNDPDVPIWNSRSAS